MPIGKFILPNSPALNFAIEFTAISNADIMLGGDRTDVEVWNTFFDLPTNGAVFTDVEESGNMINLFGGGGMTIKDQCFSVNDAGNNYIKSVKDNSEIVKKIGVNSFYKNTALISAEFIACSEVADGNQNAVGAFAACPLVTAKFHALKVVSLGMFASTRVTDTSLEIPNAIEIKGYAFYSVATLINPVFPKVVTVTGGGSFGNCSGLANPSFPELERFDGDATFNPTTAMNQPTFPKLKYIGTSVFCNSTIRVVDWPLVEEVADYAFAYSDAAKSLNFPACRKIGAGAFREALLTGITMPLLEEAGDGAFQQNYNVPAFEFPWLWKAGSNCFQSCFAATVYDLHRLTTVGPTTGNNNLWAGVSGVTISLNIPAASMADADVQALIAANTVTVTNPVFDLLFQWGDITLVDAWLGGDRTNIANWNAKFDLPTNGTPFTSYYEHDNICELIGGANIILNTALMNNTNIIRVKDEIVSIIELGQNSFGNCGALTRVEFKGVTKISGANTFQNCRQLHESIFPELTQITGSLTFWYCNPAVPIEFYFPKLTQAGSTTGTDNLFGGITGKTLKLTCPEAVRTDGDIASLISQNTTELVTPPEFKIVWGDITLVDAWLGGPRNDIASWNSKFGLPANGTPFTAYSESGNSSTLDGGGDMYIGIQLKENPNLLKVIDTKGIITSCGYAPFAYEQNATEFRLHGLTDISAGGCFTNSYGISIIEMPELTIAGNNSFQSVQAVTSLSFPKLQSIGNSGFYNCTQLANLSIPVCTALGTTTGDNSVFANISGKTFTLTIPTSIHSDGDVAVLQANNQVTFILEGAELLIEWVDITLCDAMIGGSRSDISKWNAFFNLPTNGTPFTQYIESGNACELKGGENLIIKTNLFNSSYNTNLKRIRDVAGIVVQIQTNTFYDCINFTEISCPAITTILGNAFYGCRGLQIINFPNIPIIGPTTGNDGVFAGITGATITLTIPTAVNTDGDVASLQASNTVTIVNP